MYNTEILPDGEVRVTDFIDGTVTPQHVYQWTKEGGWKMQIVTDTVENGFYWRTFKAENTISVLENLKQNAINALERRKGDE